jgi:toxin-antitoxin system PIN domain toxin
MLMPDANILVYAHREDTAQHERYRLWLTQLATGPSPFALSEFSVHGFVRIVTNPRIFAAPSSSALAFSFVDALLSRGGCTMVRPGAKHFEIYRKLCESPNINGKIAGDAVQAALAIESGCELVTTDTDYARFAPLLRWKHI